MGQIPLLPPPLKYAIGWDRQSDVALLIRVFDNGVVDVMKSAEGSLILCNQWFHGFGITYICNVRIREMAYLHCDVSHVRTMDLKLWCELLTFGPLVRLTRMSVNCIQCLCYEWVRRTNGFRFTFVSLTPLYRYASTGQLGRDRSVDIQGGNWPLWTLSLSLHQM